MNYLSVENLTKSFGIRTLFKNITFGIDKGQKVAFIAKNGTGKSTFLRILFGTESYDDGKVVFRNGIKVGFLHQSPEFPANKTIEEIVFSVGSEQIAAIKAYTQATQNPDNADLLQQAYDKMDALDAWNFESNIKQILGKLAIYELDKNIDELSGGQQKRVALAQVLIDYPDFLILDEPTNHLDIDMIEWLEEYLSKENITLLMVTHDRYFLERVCTEIIELDDQTLYKYKGNYSYFLQKKEERETVFDANVNKAKNLFRKELEWMRRMPKARGTKAKYREEAFYKTEEIAHQKKDNSKVNIEVNMSRLGGKILEFHHVNKSYDSLKILHDFNYVFKKGERVGFVGKNGVGKTTFLNLLMGIENIDGGKIIHGETVIFGYYTQQGMKLKNNKRVIDTIKDIAEVIPLAKGKKLTAAQLLETFLFPKQMHYNLVEKLSGGEKRRLYLLTILIKNPNFLILDEPTNDLDIITLNVLEDFLQEFPGCIIIVSHDRYFMDKLVDHLFIFEGDGVISDFIGKYNEYKVSAKSNSKIKPPNKKELTTNKKNENQSKAKLSYKEKIEFETLEKEIPQLESKKKMLNQQLIDNHSDHEEIIKLTNELALITKQLDNKIDRWIRLSEYS